MKSIPVILLIAAFGALGPAEVAAQFDVSGRAASIRFGGRIHTQYATSSVGAADSGFFFRRARFNADATVNDFVSGRLQLDFAGGETAIKDGYLRLAFAPTFELSMGQFKRAFDAFELPSSTDQALIERDGRVAGVDTCSGVGGVCSFSRFTQKLSYSDRDTGLKVEGATGAVEYAVTLTNGTGANEDDENDTKSISGRLAVDVTDDLTVAGQLARHDYPDPSDESAGATAWSLDVRYGDWRDGLRVNAAVVRGDNWKNLDDSGAPSTFTALQGVGSYYAATDMERLVGIEPLFRVSYGDPDTSADDDGGLVVTPGLMLYVSGKNRIGFNVDIWSPQSGDTEYSLKLQSYLYF